MLFCAPLQFCHPAPDVPSCLIIYPSQWTALGAHASFHRNASKHSCHAPYSQPLVAQPCCIYQPSGCHRLVEPTKFIGSILSQTIDDENREHALNLVQHAVAHVSLSTENQRRCKFCSIGMQRSESEPNSRSSARQDGEMMEEMTDGEQAPSSPRRALAACSVAAALRQGLVGPAAARCARG